MSNLPTQLDQNDAVVQLAVLDFHDFSSCYGIGNILRLGKLVVNNRLLILDKDQSKSAWHSDLPFQNHALAETASANIINHVYFHPVHCIAQMKQGI